VIWEGPAARRREAAERKVFYLPRIDRPRPLNVTRWGEVAGVRLRSVRRLIDLLADPEELMLAV